MHTGKRVRIERTPGQVIRIGLDKDINPNMTVSQLFGYGPIEVMVLHSHEDKTTLQVDTSPNFSIKFKSDGLF